MGTHSPYPKDDFKIWVPGVVEILQKSSKNDGDRPIGGFCSTESVDRQGEVVLQRGLDFSEFTEHGFYNDNHKQETAAVVGIPELAEYHYGKGWWTEGKLIEGVPRADEIWALAKALQKTKRRLGFSIEGKILERRDGYMITKAKIRNVAVTNSPVNIDCTWAVLTKSFCAEFDKTECNGECCVTGKALKVGHDIVPTGGGRVLVPEDLEHDYNTEDGEITHIYQCPECKKAFAKEAVLDRHLEKKHSPGVGTVTGKVGVSIRRAAKSLTPKEAAATIHRLRPQWSLTTCSKVIETMLRQQGV